MSNIYDYVNNIYIYGKNYGDIIGILSNQGANPQAPYYDDLFIQELDTGADTFQFSTMSTPYTQDILEIGNHIGFHYNNRFEMFTIASLEYSHYEGYKTIGVYAEGIGFELLEVFMEKPELPEEDEDKKYPNNIYIDENGNIIYDPEGNYEEDEDKITIDGDGNIIYHPSTNKKKNNDSIEFKNISYPKFLSMLLKNTGWSYVCQPGLESVKHDISVRYDTNIYAILQDSMQAYRGVELEFVHEGISKEGPAGGYYHSDVKKVVKAYKDGGRGSFVGKRFEYGKNVRGITKTQEVTDSEDDKVIYVDDIGVEVYYDIDFALKSAEIPEIEIGDTHYVIDRQFHPSMTIKARIGKIEISFSDPTRNKITVANNKKIRGAAIDEGDIEDFIKNPDPGDDDPIDDGGDDPGTEDPGGDDGGTPDDPGDDGPINIDGDMVDVVRLNSAEVNSCLLTVPLDAYGYKFEYGSATGVPDNSDASIFIDKQDLLDFIMNDLDIWTHIHNDVVAKDYALGVPNWDSNYYLGIGPNIEFSNNPLYFHRDKNSDGYDSWSTCEWKSPVARYIVRKEVEDINKDGDVSDHGEHKLHSYNLPSLVAALIGAFQLYVKEGSPTIDDDGTIDLSKYATKTYVQLAISNAQLGGGDDGGNDGGNDGSDVDLSDYALISYVDGKVSDLQKDIDAIDLREYATIEYVDDAIAKIDGSNDLNIPNIPSGLIEYYEQESGSMYVGESWIQVNDDLRATCNLIVDGSLVVSGALEQIEFIDADEAAIRDIWDVNSIKFADGTTLTSASSISNTPSTINETEINATIGALQEEVRMRDAKIASLEARLAKIEEMLNNK